MSDIRHDNEIAGKHLGQKSEYAEVYDPSLLVAVPRKSNRDDINVDSSNTPWKYAFDVWNCYEISSLLSNGVPFSGVGKLVYSGNSECIVESKSLKLYLNSFNQTKMESDNIDDAFLELKTIIERDLTNLLKTEVKINIHYSSIFSGGINVCTPLSVSDYYKFPCGSFIEMDDYIQDVQVSKYSEDKTLLSVYEGVDTYPILYHSSNLFSRCQITKQPDHGDLFIYIKSKNLIKTESLIKYISSIRGHNCFHEPTVETIFKNIYDLTSPSMLMVGALYTRRGGISIAPFRSTHEHLIPHNIINHRVSHVKLPRE